MITPVSKRLRIAVLVDLPRTPQSGGHVKCWERLGFAAAQTDLSINLTIYFSGQEADEQIGPYVRFRHLPPVFSTEKLKFLPYVPDHTDLASRHPQLEKELTQYDLIHTTDGFFAFAQSAAYISTKYGIPLTTSFHTDTPSYTKIFARQTIEKLFRGLPFLRHLLLETWNIPERQGRAMEQKLKNHIKACSYALVTRAEDEALALPLLGPQRLAHLRLGVDKNMFGPHRCDRAGLEHDYQVPPGHMLVLFVGRVDVGKNIYTLCEAVEKCVRNGRSIHLMVAGLGPASQDIQKSLGEHVSILGFVPPHELGRLYASVDFLALCSEVEIRSMAGVEAMTSHCPVLVSEKSHIHELFTYTSAMQVVPSGSESWVSALESLMDHTERLPAMRREAEKYSQQYLASWAQVFREDVYPYWVKAIEEKTNKTS